MPHFNLVFSYQLLVFIRDRHPGHVNQKLFLNYFNLLYGCSDGNFVSLLRVSQARLLANCETQLK